MCDHLGIHLVYYPETRTCACVALPSVITTFFTSQSSGDMFPPLSMTWVKAGIFRIIILEGQSLSVLFLAPRGGSNYVHPVQAERNIFLFSQNSTLYPKTISGRLQSHLYSLLMGFVFLFFQRKETERWRKRLNMGKAWGTEPCLAIP